jgi:Reverse transcriptase (RNA-dependent DNA polymerase)
MVAQLLVSYIDCSRLFLEFQSAYRRFHSTDTATTLVFTNIFSAIDGSDISLMSMLDMSAAVDTVDHQILLQKLNTPFGISSTVFEWFTSYLSGRLQHMRHSGNSSTTITLTCGVSQGSVLSPIVFILYTADVTEII